MLPLVNSRAAGGALKPSPPQTPQRSPIGGLPVRAEVADGRVERVVVPTLHEQESVPEPDPRRLPNPASQLRVAEMF
jgi:hypothetical protein